MSQTTRQVVIEAPVLKVWELVGDPARHPEWFPRVIEVNGHHFEQGDEYMQVTKSPFGTAKTQFVVERMDDMREIRMVCQNTGMYAHWQLTDVQGDTFVDVEMGIQPTSMGNRVFDAVAGRMYFRRWLDQTLDALRNTVARVKSAPPSA